jgi:hypothetical protein
MGQWDSSPLVGPGRLGYAILPGAVRSDLLDAAQAAIDGLSMPYEREAALLVRPDLGPAVYPVLIPLAEKAGRQSQATA